ncbi:MAG TPA: ATP-binding cassette domain-containing protein, partial [Rubrobacter sp.]|nr:ATP-binding cassette domain-containing protein [Rubrobacter sp.]
AVIGASGAGKTTLFRVLTRGVALTGGKVTVGGRDLYTLSKKELKAVRRTVGSIYQAYNLVPQLPVGVNAALGEVGEMGVLGTLRTFLTGPDPALSSRVTKALARVGLEEKARARTIDLSGGQQQRVAVARLLVQRPNLVLADEPFAAVDPVTTERVFEALLELNREGAALLVNLHDVELARRFPRLVALRKGRVVFDGSPEQLSEEALHDIYAGDDPYKEVAHPEPVDKRPTQPISLAEGRDGVSSH